MCVVRLALSSMVSNLVRMIPSSRRGTLACDTAGAPCEGHATAGLWAHLAMVLEGLVEHPDLVHAVAAHQRLQRWNSAHPSCEHRTLLQPVQQQPKPPVPCGPSSSHSTLHLHRSMSLEYCRDPHPCKYSVGEVPDSGRYHHVHTCNLHRSILIPGNWTRAPRGLDWGWGQQSHLPKKIKKFSATPPLPLINSYFSDTGYLVRKRD